MHRLGSMRVLAMFILVVLLSGLGPPGAQAPPAGPPRLTYELDLYPGDLYGPFRLGNLTEGGCSPLYIPSPREGCALIRNEPAWVKFRVDWTGETPLRLSPAGAAFVHVIPRRAPKGVTSWPITVRWQPGAGQERGADGSFLVSATRGLSFRIDLSELTRSLPAGSYLLCFRPSLVPQSGARWEDRGDSDCYGFELFENDSLPTRLELLRRRAIDRLAEFDCAGATPVIDEMLDLDAGSAVAYRLRAIVAELQRRLGDAIADYTQASHLLRTGGDRALPLTPEQRVDYADNLDEWRFGLERAQVRSLIGDGNGPVCR